MRSIPIESGSFECEVTSLDSLLKPIAKVSQQMIINSLWVDVMEDLKTLSVRRLINNLDIYVESPRCFFLYVSLIIIEHSIYTHTHKNVTKRF